MGSFLTPKHFQDASRILRGLALVAARAVAESPLMRDATQTLKGPSLESALKEAKRQATEVVTILRSQAAQQTPNAEAFSSRKQSSHRALNFRARRGAASVTANPLADPLPKWDSQAVSRDVPASRLGSSGARTGTPSQEAAPHASRSGSAQSPSTAAAEPTAPATRSSPLGTEASTMIGAAPSPAPGSEAVGAVPHNRVAGEPGAPVFHAANLDPGRLDVGSKLNGGRQAGAQAVETMGDWVPGVLREPKDPRDGVALGEPPAIRQNPQAATAVDGRRLPAAAVAGQETADRRQGTAEPGPAVPRAPSGAQPQPAARRKPRERSVPASPMGRVLGFAQLGASLVYGSVADSVSGFLQGRQRSSNWMTEANAERLADALCRMRGAALKLGQMLSIQDEQVLPPQLTAALERVRAGADIMPRRQLEAVLRAELGPEWRSLLATFDDEPLAAASIGQVHGGTLHDGRRVAMKIQYPGVARSIESDVDNLLRIISVANVLPKGMYIENAAKVAKRELALECDYQYEARCQDRFGRLVGGDASFAGRVFVPAVVPELCSSRILTTEFVEGVHIDKMVGLPQEERDEVASLLLHITLRELFTWRFMQTDPNWGNFLYDSATRTLNLIDFGASREYPKAFVDEYLCMVRACAERDRPEIIRRSINMGFLTGDESALMLDAHCEAGYIVGHPFSQDGDYNFAEYGTMTKKVSNLGAIMVSHRLKAPPEDAYSLHRKLSGAFLACIKLRARVPCRRLFYEVYNSYRFGPEADPVALAA
eukprot:jgi/Botrbrau1/11874/Bobra.126_2s0009.1